MIKDDIQKVLNKLHSKDAKCLRDSLQYLTPDDMNVIYTVLQDCLNQPLVAPYTDVDVKLEVDEIKNNQPDYKAIAEEVKTWVDLLMATKIDTKDGNSLVITDHLLRLQQALSKYEAMREGK